MRFSAASLGLKLNLSLIFFFLMVGSATAAILLFSFKSTQDNATDRSEEALEELGEQRVEATLAGQSDYGALALEAAAEMGYRASRYLETFRRADDQADFDPATLTRDSRGVVYDPNPDRITDVGVPANVELTDAVLDDLAYSAPLDGLLPALMADFPGSLRDANFNPIAIIFISANNTVRYYPPSFVHERFDPNTDLSTVEARLGPEANPDRNISWTPPYEDRAGKGLVLTAEVPVYEGDTYRGTLQVDLSLANLVQQVNMLKLTSIGFAFYMDKEGNILESESSPLVQAELEGGNQAFAAILESMNAGNSGVDKLMIGGQEMFVAYDPIEGVGGSLAITASVEEITAQAAQITAGIEDDSEDTLRATLISMGALFLLGLAGSTYLNRRVLIRPIEALVTGTRAVASGDLDTSIPVKGNDELATLAGSFNTMTSDLRQRRDALRAEISEREAAQNQLRAVFAAMTDIVILMDREGRLLRVASTNAPALKDNDDLQGRLIADVLPEDQVAGMLEQVERALTTGLPQTFEAPFDVSGESRWFSLAMSPTSPNEVVVVSRDITDRVQANQELERQVEERTRELTALLGISNDIASTLDLGPLLELVIDEVRTVADYNRCSIFTLEGDRWVMLDSRSLNLEGPVSLSIPSSTIEPIARPIAAGRYLIIDDVRGDTPEAKAYASASGELFDTVFRDIHSWMGVPLTTQDRVIGMLTLSHNQAAFYTERHASLVSAIATQVAVAIENARLYQELEGLLGISKSIASTLDLAPLLRLAIDGLKQLVDYTRCSIFTLEGDRYVLVESRSETAESRIRLTIPRETLGPINSGHHIIMEDVRGDSDAARDWAAVTGDLYNTSLRDIHSWMAVPLISKDRVIGMLTLSHGQAGFFTEHHADVIGAIATQIAAAIENAQLYQQAQELAAVQERQRLARELHDSVSQALYGIALGARTARTLLDRDPAQAIQPVDYVLSLAEAGLAEMRALIFELRPESLEIEGLVAAIEKQVAATATRYSIEVTSELGEEPDMSLAQKEVFYRICQEALHNVVKHAHADNALVRLSNGAGTTLEIRDNGVGFDAGQSFPGHMGLVSMTERAVSIGARLHVESKPGAGTKISLTLPG